MLSFKDFLKGSIIAEGGNITVPHPETGEQVGSESIDSNDRYNVSKDIHNSLSELDSSFKKKHGESLFGKGLNTGSIYAGSTKHFMDPNISDKEFIKHKPKVGDVDTQIREQHKDKLHEHLTTGSKFGNFSVVGTKKHGAQVSALMRHEPTGKIHQVDFEPVEYDDKKQEPSEFAKFSHSSDWNDVKNGVKGSFHKILLSSTTAAHSKPGIVEDKKGKREIQDIEPHAFSVDRGLRDRHKQVDTVSDLPVMKEVSPKESTYDKDTKSIYNKLFNRKGSDQDVSEIGSFDGVASHIKQHLSPEQHKKVLDKFTNSLWDTSRAQTLSKNPVEDHETKQKAVSRLEKHFPEYFAANKERLQNMKDDFYDKKYKSKSPISTSINESSNDMHIAMVNGRLNGPTQEHAKLLDRLFSTNADKHYVFVSGPKSKEETSEKDPLTADEKVEHLKKLYPEKADSFIAGTSSYTKTPNQAMAYLWHKHKDDAKNIHLHVVAGSGDEGVKSKSAAGGSAENYRELLDKYNGTKFPERTDENGNKVGGDYRMNYKSTNIIENPRGATSGSVVRKFAKENDPNNEEHVSQFKKLLHPRFTEEHAQELMHQMHSRLNRANESYINIFSQRLKYIK